METMVLENSSTSAKETTNSNYSKNTELIKRKQIDKTPFTLVTDEEKGSFIAIGQHRITEYGDKHELEEKVRGSNIDWGFLTSTIATLITIINNENK